MTIRFVFLFIGLAFIVSSCSKDADKQLTNEQKLTGATWQVMSAYEIPVNNINNDTTNAVKVNCAIGGSFNLLPDGTVSSNLPAGNCMLIEDNDQYTWEYRDVEPFIIIKNASGVATFSTQVTKLTDSSVVLVGNAGKNSDSLVVFRYYYLEAL